jgi:hypothetical protein
LTAGTPRKEVFSPNVGRGVKARCAPHHPLRVLGEVHTTVRQSAVVRTG